MPTLYAALAFVLGVGFVWLLFDAARRGRPDRDAAAGAVTFRHGRLLRGFAVFALFGAEAAFAVWLLFFPPKSGRDAGMIVAAAVALGAAGALLVWEAFRFAVTASADGLDCRSPWRGRRFVPWQLVTAVGYSRVNAWFAVHTPTGPAFHVPAVVPGAGEFLAACERHLKPEQLLPARPGYRLLRRRFPEVPR